MYTKKLREKPRFRAYLRKVECLIVQTQEIKKEQVKGHGILETETRGKNGRKGKCGNVLTSYDLKFILSSSKEF